MGEINVYGNVHVFGENPPLTVYGAVLNVHRTRRDVYYLDSTTDFIILTYIPDCARRYVRFYDRLQMPLNSNVPRF